MADEKPESPDSPNASSGTSVRLQEGYQPGIKGTQPAPLQDNPASRGHKPDTSNLNPLTPPQGGSGVPPVQGSGETTKPEK